MVTLNEAAILIYGVLNADATLISSSLLNGSNRIQNHPLRMAGEGNPTLTIEVREDGEGETGTSNYFLRLRLFLDVFGKKTADVARASFIERRIYELLNRKQLSNAATICRQSYRVNSSGPFMDAEATTESMWFYDYRMIGVKEV